MTRSFGLSVLLHGLIAAIVVVLFVQTQSVLREPAPPIFVLSGSSTPSVLGDPASLPSAATPSIHVPVPPAPVHHLAPVEADPVVAPVANRPVHPAIPAAPPRPASPRMSYDTFTKLHPAAPSSAVRSAPGPVAHVSTDYRPVRASAPVSLDDPGDLAFASALLRDLRAAFPPPAGDCSGLQATVEFRLAADGSLVAVRLLRSSGQSAFDAAVLAAFRSVRARGFQPADADVAYQLTFRTAVD